MINQSLYDEEDTICQKNQLSSILKYTYGYTHKYWSHELHDNIKDIIIMSISQLRYIYNDIEFYKYITTKTDNKVKFEEILMILNIELSKRYKDINPRHFTQLARYQSYIYDCWNTIVQLIDTSKLDERYILYKFTKNVYEMCQTYDLENTFLTYYSVIASKQLHLQDINAISLLITQLNVSIFFQNASIATQSALELEKIKNNSDMTLNQDLYDKIDKSIMNLKSLKGLNSQYYFKDISSNSIYTFKELQQLGFNHINELILFADERKCINLQIDTINQTVLISPITTYVKQNEYNYCKNTLITELKQCIDNKSIYLRTTPKTYEENRLKIEEEHKKHAKNLEEKKKRQLLIETENKRLETISNIKDTLKAKLHIDNGLEDVTTEDDIIVKAQLLLKQKKLDEKTKHLDQWNEKNWSTKLSYVSTLPIVKEMEDKLYQTRKNNLIIQQQNVQDEVRNHWQIQNEKKEKLLSFKIPPGKMESSEDIIVYGLPVIGKEKEEKLIGVIKKKIKERVAIIDVDVRLVFSKGESKEFAFISHNKAYEISKAIDNLNFDKRHVLRTIYGKMINELLNLTNTFTPPPSLVVVNLITHPYEFINEDACNSFICTTDTHTIGYTNLYQTPEQKDVISLDFKTENGSLFTSFDTAGIYMYSILTDKVVLYTGKNLDPFTYFDIPNVKKVCFSKDSNLIALYDNYYINIYDISLHKLIYRLSNCSHVFTFTPSTKYFIHFNQETLEIINLETILTYHISNIKNWKIDQKMDILMYFKEGDTSRPGLINIVSLDNIKENLISKPVHSVNSVKFIVNSDQKKIIAVLTRNNQLSCLLQQFNLEDLSTKITEISNSYTDIQWEPNGTKLSLINSKGQLEILNNFNQSSEQIQTIKAKQLFWSPTGEFLVLANFFESDTVEIINTNQRKDYNSRVIIPFKYCSHVEWDPTGRFVTLASLSTFSKSYNGCKIYTFQGDLVWEQNYQKLNNFRWRPVHEKLVKPNKSTYILEIIKGKKKNSKLNNLLKDIQTKEEKLRVTSQDNCSTDRIAKLLHYRSILSR